jgi:hypothetical protein
MRISLVMLVTKRKWDGCENYREQQQLAGAEEARRQRTKLLGAKVTIRGYHRIRLRPKYPNGGANYFRPEMNLPW